MDKKEELEEITNDENKKKIKKRVFFFIKLILILSFIGGFTYLYARYIGSYGLKVHEYKITDEKLPDSYHGTKIVHLTDIHYNTTITKKELEIIVDRINLIKPHIVVLTGDLLDRETEYSKKDLEELTSLLKNINVKTFKYAISGNHDYSHDEFNDVIENSEFINLDDSMDLIYIDNNSPILINGMSTNLHGTKKIHEKLKPLNTYLNSEEYLEPVYSIMTIHEPDYIDKFDYSNFDLILGGHSHNGQIRLPIIGGIIYPPGASKYHDPHYKLKDTDLYISPGLGTSTMKLRLSNKPSFNLYRLTNK